MTDDRTIDASPTKAFFIEMLTKDIPLPATIRDLVDNSVDGARRLRPDGNYKDLWVRIEYSEEKFSISDNCGGIPLEVAKKYAFRFGRPEDAPTFVKSVGRFGVGMKRALFKLGNKFTVESTSDEHSFKVTVDVPKWQGREKWDFEFDTVDALDNEPGPDEVGTRIQVSQLKKSVVADFKLDTFADQLRSDLEQDHSTALESELSILVNGVPLAFKGLQLLQSSEMTPVYVEQKIGPKESVRVQIYAGLGPSNPNEAGWYIICNGRQVVGAEQTSVTGWGGAEGANLPKFHNQFARFRGYVLMDADDATLLPWNTTKTGVDEDSDIYRSTRNLMVGKMRTVIDFLNKLDEEIGKQDSEDDKGPLLRKVDAAKLTSIKDIEPNRSFVAPKPDPKPKASVSRIGFRRPKEHVDLLKRITKTKTNERLGEYLFDYFVETEEIELP